MPDNVFDPEPTEDNEPTVLPEKVEKLKEKGIDELAKSKAHADQFIEFLKEQAKELKADHDKLLSENEKLKAEKVVGEARQATTVVEDREVDTTTGLNPDTIKSLVKEELESRTKQGVADANLLEVDSRIKELYKDKAAEFMKGKAAELGLSLEYLGEIAVKSPAALYSLIGISGKATGTPAPSQGTVRTPPVSAGSATPGTKKYYDALKKQNPRGFFSPEVQSKLFKDRERLGEDFYK